MLIMETSLIRQTLKMKKNYRHQHHLHQKKKRERAFTTAVSTEDSSKSKRKLDFDEEENVMAKSVQKTPPLIKRQKSAFSHVVATPKKKKKDKPITFCATNLKSDFFDKQKNVKKNTCKGKRKYQSAFELLSKYDDDDDVDDEEEQKKLDEEMVSNLDILNN